MKALESLLVEKGLLDPGTVDAWIEVYTEEIGPSAVPRWWRAPGPTPPSGTGFSPTAALAIAELGFTGGGGGGHIQVVENTAEVHYLVVLHALLVLPHRGPRHPAQLVQDGGLPGARGP